MKQRSAVRIVSSLEFTFSGDDPRSRKAKCLASSVCSTSNEYYCCWSNPTQQKTREVIGNKCSEGGVDAAAVVSFGE